jgi:hypothetical protein
MRKNQIGKFKVFRGRDFVGVHFIIMHDNYA